LKYRWWRTIGFVMRLCTGLRRQTANEPVVWASGLLLVASCLGCASMNGAGQSGFLPDRQAQRKQQVARQFDEKRDRAEFEAACAAWQRGDLAGAQQSLEALLQRNARHRDALLLMIDVCLAANRIEEALRYAQAARSSFPDDAQVHYAAATVLDYASRQQEALACYEQAARLDPANEVYAVSYHAAREALLGRSASPILTTAPRAIGASNQTATVGSAGRSSACNCEGFAEGDEVAGLMDRADDALRTAQPELALALMREAAARRPDDPQIVIRGATAALRYDHPDLAIELLEPAAARFAHVAAVHCTLAVARYRVGDYRASQVALRQALSLDKSSALTYFLMGCTLRKLGQLEQAEAHFRQAAMLDPRYAQYQ